MRIQLVEDRSGIDIHDDGGVPGDVGSVCGILCGFGSDWFISRNGFRPCGKDGQGGKAQDYDQQ